MNATARSPNGVGPVPVLARRGCALPRPLRGNSLVRELLEAVLTGWRIRWASRPGVNESVPVDAIFQLPAGKRE